MLKLVLPERVYFDAAKSGVEEFISNPTEFDVFAAEKLVEAYKSGFEGYFEKLANSRNGIAIKEGNVPYTTFWLFDDELFVGILDLRHSLNDKLTERGGHVAYQIVPSLRGKGYAKSALRECLKYAKKVHGIERVLLTCKQENTASYKAMFCVMEEVGGEEIATTTTDGSINLRLWLNTL